MGIKNYLIDGVSGAGKTTVATELERRGYQAIHGDRQLAYRGDPKTGLPVTPETNTPTAEWLSEHHLWDLKKVKELISKREEPITFFCGGCRNLSEFRHLLDDVFILEIDEKTMNQRIDERVEVDPTDFGGTPEERRLITELYSTKQDIPEDAISIDATLPINQVVEDILSKYKDR